MEKIIKKVWLVTGASKGLGLALTQYLLNQGEKVIATSRDISRIPIEIIEHENILALNIDITSENAVKDAVEKAIIRFGRIDVIVNNVGYGLVGAIEEINDTEFRKTIDVNFFGAVNVIRASLPTMRRQKSGHIINISSISGYLGSALSGSYDAAKFAIVGLSESLESEVKEFGINVTVVIPGLFRTNFMDTNSLQITSTPIAEYKSLQQMKAWQAYSGLQPGDPTKLAKALKEIVEMEHPPTHLLLGSDAYQKAIDKMKINIIKFEKWKALSISTDYENH